MILLTILLVALGGLLGVSLFLAMRAEAQFPRTGKLLTVEGLQLHVVEKGEGRPVVLIHGAFGALQDFTATIADRLSRNFRVIAIDRPGHGYSEAPPDGQYLITQARLIRNAAKALGAERPIIVGFSFGGAVALTHALEHGADTGALVLINSPAMEWPGRIDFLFRWPGWPVVGPLLVRTIAMPVGLAQLKSAAAAVFAPEPMPANFSASPASLGLRPGSFLMTAAERRVLKPALRAQMPRYRRLRIPVIILAGEADRTVRATRHSYGLRAQVPDSELIVLPGLGHNLLYGHAETVIAAIEKAAARMAGSQPGQQSPD